MTRLKIYAILTLICLHRAEGGIDDSPIAAGIPSKSEIPTCWTHLDDEKIDIKADGSNLPKAYQILAPKRYRIYGICDWLHNKTDQACLILDISGHFHTLFENNDDNINCNIHQLSLSEERYNFTKRDLLNNKNQTIDNYYETFVSLNRESCNNITCSLALCLDGPGEKVKHVTKINTTLHQYFSHNKGFYSEVMSENLDSNNAEYFSKNSNCNSSNPENNDLWILELQWERKPEPYENNEVNFSSVGIMQDILSGIYTMNGAKLRYRLDQDYVKENQRNVDITLASWEKHRFRAHSGDYFSCHAEQHIIFYEGNNTLVNPYVHEIDSIYVDKEKLNLTAREAPRVILSMFGLSFQLFGEHLNRKYDGPHTSCLADMDTDHTLTLIIFSLFGFLVMIILIIQTIEKCREKDRISKKFNQDYVIGLHYANTGPKIFSSKNSIKNN